MEKIQIRIKPNGNAIISVDGVKGTGCTEITKGLEQVMGEVVQEEKTSDYFQEEGPQTLTQFEG